VISPRFIVFSRVYLVFFTLRTTVVFAKANLGRYLRSSSRGSSLDSRRADRVLLPVLPSQLPVRAACRRRCCLTSPPLLASTCLASLLIRRIFTLTRFASSRLISLQNLQRTEHPRNDPRGIRKALQAAGSNDSGFYERYINFARRSVDFLIVVKSQTKRFLRERRRKNGKIRAVSQARRLH